MPCALLDVCLAGLGGVTTNAGPPLSNMDACGGMDERAHWIGPRECWLHLERLYLWVPRNMLQVDNQGRLAKLSVFVPVSGAYMVVELSNKDGSACRSG